DPSIPSNVINIGAIVTMSSLPQAANDTPLIRPSGTFSPHAGRRGTSCVVAPRPARAGRGWPKAGWGASSVIRARQSVAEPAQVMLPHQLLEHILLCQQREPLAPARALGQLRQLFVRGDRRFVV